MGGLIAGVLGQEGVALDFGDLVAQRHHGAGAEGAEFGGGFGFRGRPGGGRDVGGERHFHQIRKVAALRFGRAFRELGEAGVETDRRSHVTLYYDVIREGKIYFDKSDKAVHRGIWAPPNKEFIARRSRSRRRRKRFVTDTSRSMGCARACGIFRIW